MEDPAIVALFWDRNEAALAETQKKYHAYCYSIAHNILSDTEDAKETVNDALMGAWNSIPPHRPAVLSAFLGKLTRNAALKRLRHARAQKRGGGETALVFEELSFAVESKQSVEDELTVKELAQTIDRFLEEISETERRVFVCRYWYFDSIDAISAQCGFTPSKVKSMLHRLRKRLHKTLTKEGFLP